MFRDALYLSDIERSALLQILSALPPEAEVASNFTPQGEIAVSARALHDRFAARVRDVEPLSVWAHSCVIHAGASPSFCVITPKSPLHAPPCLRLTRDRRPPAGAELLGRINSSAATFTA